MTGRAEDAVAGAETPAKRRRGVILGRLAVSSGLLAWLFAGQDWDLILEAMGRLDVWVFLGVLMIHLFSKVVSSCRWHLAGRRLGLASSWKRYLELFFLGMFFNLFLPTSFGGDVVKSYFLGRENRSQLHAAFSVFIDRACGLAALMCAGACALPFTEHITRWQAGFLVLAAAGSLAGIGAAPWLLAVLNHVTTRFSRWLEPLAELRRAPGVLAAVFGLSLAVQGMSILVVALLGGALGLELPFAFYCSSLAVITLLTLLPSISGLGVREAGFVLFFQQAGVMREEALALSLLYFAVHLGGGLAGLIPFSASRRRSPPAG